MHLTRAGFALTISLAITATSFAQLERIWYRNFADRSEFTKTKHLVATDSRGNCYLVARAATSVNNQDIQIRKVGADGALVWERWIAGTASANDYANAIAVDRSDNLVIAGTVQNTTTGNDALLAKYSPTGEVVFSNQLDGGRGFGDAWTRLLLGPSGALYVEGYQNETSSIYGASTLLVQARSAAGAILWTKQTTGLTSSQASSGIMALRPAITYAGEVANSKVISKKLPSQTKFMESPATLVVIRSNGAGRGEMLATSYDALSGREFARKGLPSYIFGPRDIRPTVPNPQPWVADLGVVDSVMALRGSANGQLTLFGGCTYLGTKRAFVIRLSSQLVPVWATRYDPTSGLDSWVGANGGLVDSNGNCYVAGNSGASAGASRGYVARISNAGRLDWQFSDPKLAWLGGGIAMDSRGTIYAAGQDEALGSSQSKVCVMSFEAIGGRSRLVDLLDTSDYRPEGGFRFASSLTRPDGMALATDGTLFVGGEFGAPRFSASLLVAYRVRRKFDYLHF